MTQKSNLIGGSELEQVRGDNPSLGNLLRRIVNAVNQTAQNAGISPIGEIEAPPPVGAVTVKASGGLVHATVTDPGEITKSDEYFLEHDTDPNFTGPHVKHMGASRGAFLNLPAMNDAGQPQLWYFRAYKQKPGSKPSQPVYYGGLSPQGVAVGGATQLTPLQSTGSGTASTLGGQGGWGRGKIPFRPSQGRS